MPPLEYSWEVRERAKELYVVDGLTFEEVAAALPQYFPAPTPSVTQLKRWSAEEGEWEIPGEEGQEPKKGKDWPESRKDFRLALSSIRRDSVLLRAKLIGNALGEPEFKKVLSAAMWEKTQQGKGAQAGKPAPLRENQRGASAPATTGTPATEPIGAEAIVLKTPQEAVAGLEEALARHLQGMLAGLKPIDLKAIKNFKDCLALVEELKTKYLPDEKTGLARGLSPEAAAQIRKQILGIK